MAIELKRIFSIPKGAHVIYYPNSPNREALSGPLEVNILAGQYWINTTNRIVYKIKNATTIEIAMFADVRRNRLRQRLDEKLVINTFLDNYYLIQDIKKKVKRRKLKLPVNKGNLNVL